MGCLLQGNSFLIAYQLLPDRPICFGEDEENEDRARENEEGKGSDGGMAGTRREEEEKEGDDDG